MDLIEIKLYLKIDGNDEDTLLQSFQIAAEEYLENAGVYKDYTRELYKLAVKLLIAHWHENREVIGKEQKLAFSLSSMINQLKHTQIEV